MGVDFALVVMGQNFINYLITVVVALSVNTHLMILQDDGLPSVDDPPLKNWRVS